MTYNPTSADDATFECKTPIRAMNNKVACEPYPSNVVEKEIKGGMAVPKQRGTLTKLKVVFNSGKEFGGPFYSKGSTIWVRADTFIQQWAKDVYDLDGVKFVLIPEEHVVMAQS